MADELIFIDTIVPRFLSNMLSLGKYNLSYLENCKDENMNRTFEDDIWFLIFDKSFFTNVLSIKNFLFSEIHIV